MRLELYLFPALQRSSDLCLLTVLTSHFCLRAFEVKKLWHVVLCLMRPAVITHTTHTLVLSWHPTNRVTDVHLYVPGVVGPSFACCPDFMPYLPGLLGTYCLTRQQFPQIANVWWLSAGSRLPLSSSPHIGMEWRRWTHPKLAARTLNLDETLSQAWHGAELTVGTLLALNWNAIPGSDMVDWFRPFWISFQMPWKP